jgi:hypothetical protein
LWYLALLSCSAGASIAANNQTNYIRQQEFCEWAIQKCVDQPNFLLIVFLDDEAGFTGIGVFNSH